MFSLICTWIAFIGVVFLSSGGEVLILSISTSWAMLSTFEERISNLSNFSSTLLLKAFWVVINSLVSQEKEQIYVNFIFRNDFNNNAYRSNFGSNNPRSFPSNNYGNNNTYPSTKNSTSELESMLKDFITTQKAFNKSVEEKLEKLDILSSKVDNIAHDVEMLKIRTSPPEERKTTPMNAIQVKINENIRMLGKIKERWAREKEEE